MKKIIVLIVLISLICGGVFYFQTEIINSLFDGSQKEEVAEEAVPPKQEQKLEEKVEPKTAKEISKELVQQKIEKIKKRLALKGFIAEGDEYFQNDQLAAALKSYLQAYKQNHQDEQIIKKLGDTYFEMNKFKAAQKYYKEIVDYQGFDKNKLAYAIMYFGNYETPESREEIVKELQQVGLGDDEYFYYKNSITCITDFHECKVHFQNYGKSVNDAGEEIIEPIENTDIQEVKTAIHNYENFQVDELYFKDALIVGALYKSSLYPIAIKLGESLLQDKENYRPILKIVADSYYELGDYENAKIYLNTFYELDKTDGGIAYLLGVISSELEDNVLSNIYLAKALENGYEPTIDIRRKIVHNYFLLESEENMINAFYDLIESEENYEKDDLELAVYYYILYEKYDQAKIWIQKGMEKYPTEENFHGYLGWIKKDLGDLSSAREEFEKGLEINNKNPFLNFNMALLEKETGNTPAALVYFKSVTKYSEKSEFGIRAQEEIQKIADEKNNS